MSSLRLSDFRKSVAETMKTFGQGRPVAAREPTRLPSGSRSEAAVRERLYGKKGHRTY